MEKALYIGAQSKAMGVTIRNYLLPNLFELYHINATQHDCLCEEENMEGLEGEVIISDPHNTFPANVECWEKIHKIVEKFPNKKFYIYYYKNPEHNTSMEAAIGKHDNITYITKNNLVKIIAGLIHSC